MQVSVCFCFPSLYQVSVFEFSLTATDVISVMKTGITGRETGKHPVDVDVVAAGGAVWFKVMTVKIKAQRMQRSWPNNKGTRISVSRVPDGPANPSTAYVLEADTSGCIDYTSALSPLHPIYRQAVALMVLTLDIPFHSSSPHFQTYQLSYHFTQKNASDYRHYNTRPRVCFLFVYGVLESIKEGLECLGVHVQVP
jgi:hypothetical protein